MNATYALAGIFITSILSACGEAPRESETGTLAAVPTEFERGPQGGRLLEEGDFALELAIFETGVPPEFRAWAYLRDEPLPPGEVDLRVTLTRLGNEVNVIDFLPQEGFLRGDSVVYEPHSFIVAVTAGHDGDLHEWEYESLEGRTAISPAMSQALGIETEVAGPAVLKQTLHVTGRIAPITQNTREIRARFEGLVQSVEVNLGDRVERGEPLLTIESNESLNPYTINSPISGVVTRRGINPGEQSEGRLLLEIMDTSTVWAELSLHPGQRNQVREGAPVTVTSPISGATAEGSIDGFDLRVTDSQAITARVVLDNGQGEFPPGTFIEATVTTGEFEVPLAVRRSGLQPFRDFTVVFAKVGNTYEVRMLELGRQDAEWVEVLGGLDPATEYVSENSYVLKADVEKSGATHDH